MQNENIPKNIIKINEVTWEIPTSYKEGMNVPARIIATEKLLNQMDKGVFDQVTNVACLPGIVKYAYCMPDAHWGYGSPVGGVVAFDEENEGVISPGIVGFDINCGMKSIITNLKIEEVRSKLKQIIDILYKTAPAGVGVKGSIKLNRQQFNDVVENGTKWCVDNGYGWTEDLERTESYGKIDWADSSKISDKSISRGINQLGTLGSGNHYLEIQHIKKEEIYDKKVAKKFGIFSDQVAIMVHSGSRGVGHQIATDYLQKFDGVMKEHNIIIKDRELSCAPFHTKEGQDYYKAMACAANFAFANRQIILHRIREAFEKVFNKSSEDLGMHLIYDVAHNICVRQEQKIDGKKRKLLVHRKGATRAFPPGHPELAPIFQETGQVVVIGGSMQTGSALLLGTKEAEETFYSVAHGSGRTMSRTQARHEVRGEKLQKEMEEQGIYVKSVSMSGLAEEAGSAYKDLSDVLDSVVKAKIGKLLCILRPVANLKG